MISLHDTEKMLATYRKTWFVFLFTGIASALLALAPFAILLASAFTPLSLAAIFPPSLFWLLSALWWWGIWTGTFVAFMNYYLDVLIVTNERILNIQQHGPFSRTVAELRLERIQDIMIEQHGFLPTLLHFGTIRIQSAGESPAFTFDAVPRPTRVKEIIMQAQRAALMRQHKHASEEGHGA